MEVGLPEHPYTMSGRPTRQPHQLHAGCCSCTPEHADASSGTASCTAAHGCVCCMTQLLLPRSIWPSVGGLRLIRLTLARPSAACGQVSRQASKWGCSACAKRAHVSKCCTCNRPVQRQCMRAARAAAWPASPMQPNGWRHTKRSFLITPSHTHSLEAITATAGPSPLCDRSEHTAVQCASH